MKTIICKNEECGLLIPKDQELFGCCSEECLMIYNLQQRILSLEKQIIKLERKEKDIK